MRSGYTVAAAIASAILISACARDKLRGSGPPRAEERYTEADEQDENSDPGSDDGAENPPEDSPNGGEEPQVEPLPIDSPDVLREPSEDTPASPSDEASLRAVLLESVPEVSNGGAITLHVAGDGILAYRSKLGVTANINCSDEESYTDEQLVTIPLVLSMDGMPDGGVTLCLIGRDGSRWQSHENATRFDWVLARTGLRDFEIAPIVAPENHGWPLEITWTRAPEARGYRVSLARIESGCASPTLTLPDQEATAITVVERLAHGRYVACVSAFDERGNVASARNSGQVVFDTPPLIHLVYFVDTGLAARELRYATRSGASGPWSDVEIAKPWSGGRFEGSVSMQIGSRDDLPRIAYRVVEPGILGPSRAALGLASPRENAFVHTELATLSDLTASRLLAPLALDADGRSQMLLATSSASRGRLLYISGAMGSEAAALPLPTHELADTYQDASLVVDSEGRAHVAYVVGGALSIVSAGSAASAWEEPRAISGDACQTVDFATLAASPRGATGVAYLCTMVNGRGSSCELRLARRDVTGDWHGVTVATVDSRAACLPFTAARPALAFGLDGRAHIGFRYTIEEHPAEYDVAVATLSVDGVIERQRVMEEWGPLTGNVRLVLDASSRLHVGYVAPEGIRLAWGDVDSELRRETVALQTSTALLDLADLAIAGGTTRNVYQGAAQ